MCLTTTKLISACTRNIITLSSPAPLTLCRKNEWKDTESAERIDDARQTRVIVTLRAKVDAFLIGPNFKGARLGASAWFKRKKIKMVRRKRPR